MYQSSHNLVASLQAEYAHVIPHRSEVLAASDGNLRWQPATVGLQEVVLSSVEAHKQSAMNPQTGRVPLLSGSKQGPTPAAPVPATR